MGLCQFKIFRGRSLSMTCTRLISGARHLREPCPLGKELAQQAIVLSFVPRSQGRMGMGGKVELASGFASVKRRCSRISGPWSYVRERRSWAGSVRNSRAKARRTVAASFAFRAHQHGKLVSSIPTRCRARTHWHGP